MFALLSKFFSPLPLFLSLSLLEEGQNLEAGVFHDKEISFPFSFSLGRGTKFGSRR